MIPHAGFLELKSIFIITIHTGFQSRGSCYKLAARTLMVFGGMIGSMECLNGMRLLQVFLFKPSEYENIDGELAKIHQTTTVMEY